MTEVPASVPDVDGWIDWEGGLCPVPMDTLIQVQLRYEAERNAGQPACKAWHWPWRHRDFDSDIIAYRVVS